MIFFLQILEKLKIWAPPTFNAVGAPSTKIYFEYFFALVLQEAATFYGRMRDPARAAAHAEAARSAASAAAAKPQARAFSLSGTPGQELLRQLLYLPIQQAPQLVCGSFFLFLFLNCAFTLTTERLQPLFYR